MIPGFRAILGSTEETLCTGEREEVKGVVREREGEKGGDKYVKVVSD